MNTSFTAFNNKTYLNIQKAITVNTRADNHCLTYYKLYIQKNTLKKTHKESQS